MQTLEMPQAGVGDRGFRQVQVAQLGETLELL